MFAACLALFGCADDAGSERESTASRSEPPAAEAAGDAAPVDREAVEAALAAANDYLARNEIPKAEAILATLIQQAPRESRARELMGQLLVIKATDADRRGDRDAARELRRGALAHYRSVVELEPNSAGLRQSAGMIAVTAGQMEAALELFRDAERLDPWNPQHPLYAAQILIRQQRHREAAEALERTLTLDPNEPVAHASLAMMALEQRRFDEALAKIAEARELCPRDLRFRIQEAKIHRVRGDPRRALELLVGLSADERAREAVAYEIAAAYTARQEHVKAALAWEHCHRTRPTDPDAYLAAVRAGEALLRAGRREEARQWLAQARLAAPNAPEVRALAQALAP